MENKKYVIKDLYRENDTEYYLSNETTGLEDIWYKMWLKGEPKTEDKYIPKIFNDLKEAKRYLKEIKRQSKVEYSNNKHHYKMFGQNKPSWDIYEH